VAGRMSEDQIKKEFELLKKQIKEMEVVIRHLKRQLRK
jgi:NAD/NADP transhydrogenase alpha subunit